MKNYLILLATVLLLASCEKNIIGDFDELPASDITEKPINKKGAAFANRTKDWSFKTADLAVHWMYSWGNVVAEEIPANVEFVPMFWGKSSVTDENIARIKQLKDEGKIKYILGFNEPDGKDQANMTVDEAIALWPRLEEIGLPLGSPATVNPDNAWMKDFMAKADALGLRVDFIAVHHYGGDNVMSFINKLKVAHETFKRPIWITEFAVADWAATSPAANRYSEAQVLEFMKTVIPALDEIDWVHRYAWFDGSNAPLITSALFTAESALTPVGQLYASISPNDAIGPGQSTIYVPPVDLSELLTNGGFETGVTLPWAGFKNDAVGIATTAPRTGNYSGRVQNGDGSLLYIVAVEPGKSYVLKFFSKWNETVTTSIKPVIRNNTANAVLFTLDFLPSTNVWQETVYNFTVPAGCTEIRLVFFKGQGFPPLFLDDVSLKLK